MNILAALGIVAALVMGGANLYLMSELQIAYAQHLKSCSAVTTTASDAKFQAGQAERAALEAKNLAATALQRAHEAREISGAIMDSVQGVEREVHAIKNPAVPPLDEGRVRTMTALVIEEAEDQWKTRVMREVDQKVARALAQLVDSSSKPQRLGLGGRKPLPLPDDEINEPAGELDSESSADADLTTSP